MARVTTHLRSHGRSQTVEEVETFTHRQQLPDGREILADPAGNFYRITGQGWSRSPPDEWDAAKAERLDPPRRDVFVYERS